jgi:zinc transporter 1/2/3
MIAGLFITFIIEYIAHRWVDRRRHMFERSPATGANPEEANRQKEASEGTLSESSSSETHYTPNSLTLNTTVMEAGIIFHSVLIGLTLVVAADSGFITLFIVIVFHQIFEGFALGARIAMIPSSFIRKAILGGAFAVTTPVGMAIGIGVLSSFNGNDPSTLIAIGTLNAFSAGILLWVGVAEMWFVEWFHGPLAHAGPLKTGICFLSLVAGLVLMSFLGKWA